MRKILLLATLLQVISLSAAVKIDPNEVVIARDSFGIPHIFAPTDAGVAYGLAWANAEDAFHETQQLMYAAKGYMGRFKGMEGVKADFFAHAIGARELVESRWEKDISPEYKDYLSGFVQGLNAYAAAYPEKLKIKKAFPVNEQDVLTAYVITLSFMSWTSGLVGDAVGGKFDSEEVVFSDRQKDDPVGSNAIAMAPQITTDGNTYLCVNPHLKMDGPLSFYEAHLCSEQGLNVAGALFQGTTSVIMGTNPHLGWGMTWNYFDKADVYKLQMKGGLKYVVDGQTYSLKKRPVWLKVKIGGLTIPVRKMTYWSMFGATLKSDRSRNFYAIRFPANTSVRTAEQLYRMDRATDFKSWMDAVRIHALPLFNMVYADKTGNIFYLSGGMMPDRNPEYSWNKIIPGNSLKSLWTRLVPIDSMPHVLNPECGYVFNTNNSPFNATCLNNNDDRSRLPAYVDERPGDNNRSLRLMEFFAERSQFSFDDLKRMKFDVSFPKTGNFIRSFDPLFALDEQKYPDIAPLIRTLKNWNRKAEIMETAPTIFGAVADELFKRRGCGDDCFISGIKVEEAEFVECLRMSRDTLMKYFGRTEVAWGEIHRNRRGDVDVPLRGFADLLSPSYPKRQLKDGKLAYVPEYGDTYTMLISYGKQGPEIIRALQPCGNSLNPDSPHFNDQISMFSQLNMRELSLSKEAAMRKAEKVYHPW